MDRQFTFINSRGLILQAILTVPERGEAPPLVISCHGFLSSKNSQTNALLASGLQKAGIACLRFDFAGHGDSEGDVGTITVSRGVDDLKSAISLVSNMTSIDWNRIGLFGSSFGGNVVLWYASLFDRVGAVALKAPVSDFAAVLEAQIGSGGLDEWQKQGSIRAGSEVSFDYELYEDSKKIDTYGLARNIGCKVLISHGDRDEVVPLSQSQRLAEAIGSNALLDIVAGAGHTFKHEGELEGVVGNSVRFLQQQLIRPG